MRVYLDACLAIYIVEQPESLGKPVGKQLSQTGIVVCISDLVRMECMVGPLRANDAQRLAAFGELFARLQLVTLDGAVYDLAAELRALHNLKTADAIHLAGAVRSGCDEFWTNDDRLSRVTTGIVVRKVR